MSLHVNGRAVKYCYGGIEGLGYNLEQAGVGKLVVWRATLEKNLPVEVHILS